VGKPLFLFLFKLASHLPLSVLHRLGVALGWATYLLSGRYADRLRENLHNAFPDLDEDGFRRALRSNVTEMGKSLTELPWLWRRPLATVTHSVRQVWGFEHVEAALRDGKGLIVLAPHLGCFEMIGLYVAARTPMTCMYRIPRMLWLDSVIRGGRERGQMKLAPADVSGVRAMLKALKRGEVVGILPDQAPGKGEGEWVEFFGRPAYTMTLVERLAQTTGAAVVVSYALRLPKGDGYELHFTPFAPVEGESYLRTMNCAVEDAVRVCPEQYLWNYNRYKTPAGAEPSPANEEA